MPRTSRTASSAANPCMSPVAAVAVDQMKKPPASTRLTSKRSTSQPTGIWKAVYVKKTRKAGCRAARRKGRARPLDERRRDGEVAAIDVVDENGKGEQEKYAAEGSGKPFVIGCVRHGPRMSLPARRDGSMNSRSNWPRRLKMVYVAAI